MSSAIARQKFCALGLLSFLAACGGSPGGSPEAVSPPVVTPPSATTTLAVSVSTLALSVNGAPRVLTVVNTGAAPAELVEVDPAVTFPAGTSHVSNCATLAPGASCAITITPGAVASATLGVAAPAAVALSIRGGNTNTQTVQVHVLDYGSVYQGGHVFAMDDTTVSTGSIGGKVAMATAGTTSWSHHFAGVNNMFEVPGVSDSSVGPLPSCNGKVDGACNTQLIVAAPEHAGVPLANHAAGACSGSTLNGYSDWYLPAICEMGPNGANGCPGGETMQEKLQTPGHVSFGDSWSATQVGAAPIPFAWFYRFATLVGGDAAVTSKNTLLAASCVRRLAH